MSDLLVMRLNKAMAAAQQDKYLAAGATDEQVRSFRKGLGDELSKQLPESFYAFYGWHNGSGQGTYDRVPFHDGESLLSLERMVNCWRTWKAVAEEGHFAQYVEGAWWDSAWIPYIQTDWYVQVIDTKGSFGGEPGQIIGFDYKSASDRSILYASFDHWLAWLLELLKADLWRPGEMSDEQYEAQDGQYLTLSERRRADQLITQLDSAYPWQAELFRYRQAAIQNSPNSYWANLEKAIENDDLSNVQHLVEENKIALSEQNPHQEANFTPLHLAIKHKAWPIALWLILIGADLSIKDAYGFTPLTRLTTNLSIGGQDDAQAQQLIAIFDAAAQNGHVLPLNRLAYAAIQQNNALLLRYALQHGASANATLPFSLQPLLHQTVTQSWFTGYQLLLDAGADLTQLDRDGKTANNFLEPHLEQRLSELVKLPSLRNKRLIVGLADFFRAEERLDTFLTHIHQQIDTLPQPPHQNHIHQLAFALLSDILQEISS